ncbi:NAD(P) transhydrogenase subunit alpha [candidate division KSB1 bacterium]|nr:NAD(P) transhydrogenase subunit alpha [candidate division KSB1 bacterium]RQW05492.1 MAG: NAD(P) transhydrogenase subunit alpha [candidate division KSB1 bacterium]
MAELIIMILVFGLSIIIGYFLISRVPSLLHTPLMSMTNAISAIIIIGAILVFSQRTTIFVDILGAVAIIAATFNVVGGFKITDRMLKMFKGDGRS